MVYEADWNLHRWKSYELPSGLCANAIQHTWLLRTTMTVLRIQHYNHNSVQSFSGQQDCWLWRSPRCWSGCCPVKKTQCNDLHIRLIGGSKVPLGVNKWCVSSAMDWQTIWGAFLPLAHCPLGLTEDRWMDTAHDRPGLCGSAAQLLSCFSG